MAKNRVQAQADTTDVAAAVHQTDQQAQDPRRRRNRTIKSQAKRLRKASSVALHAVDELYNVREFMRGFQCLEDMLIPHDSHEIETFYYDQGDLRMLVTAVRGEMQRRLNALGAHVERVHGLLLTKRERETVQ